MNKDSFVFSKRSIKSFHTVWKAPSNIALVKYWGKYGVQLPKNPSISFTLSNCVTTTEVSFSPNDKKKYPTFEFYFNKKERKDFHPKINQFFEYILPYFPILEDHHMVISSINSFPHSSGIASSASAMAALALCVVDFEKQFHPELGEQDFFKKASFLARLGSGSASRSIKGPLTLWGNSPAFRDSSDLYAIAFDYGIHKIFKTYCDTILIVDKEKKQVSSSVGHKLMQEHPFAENRFDQANRNCEFLKSVLKTGDIERFIEITESEALTLHSMMMTSSPRYLLLKPNTLNIINRVWEYRFETNTPISFTLDAGANVHLLYPANESDKVITFIKSELLDYCQSGQFIQDRVGQGAKKM